MSGVTVSNGKASVVKDPDALLDYTFDWTEWLEGHTPADTIASAVVTVTGCTLVTSSVVAQQKVVAWIGGGVVDVAASATCRITTAGGRIDDRTLTLKIKER
jgi:hypothetical protein